MEKINNNFFLYYIFKKQYFFCFFWILLIFINKIFINRTIKLILKTKKIIKNNNKLKHRKK